MRFQGQLSVADQSGPGLKVALEVADRHLSVTSGGESLGMYPLSKTSVERVTGNRFRLVIGNEVLDFAADDALGFSYEFMPSVTRAGVMRPRPFRGLVGRRRVERSTLLPRHQPVQPEPEPLVLEPEAELAESFLTESEPFLAESFVTEFELTELEPLMSEVPLTTPSEPPGQSGERVAEVEVSSGGPEFAIDAAADPVIPPSIAEHGELSEPRPNPMTGCRGVRADGAPCGSVAVGASGFCFAHDPSLAFERRQMTERVTNAANRARSTSPDLESLVVRLESAVAQVHDGSLDPQQAMAMASLVQAMCDTIGVSRGDSH